MNLTEARDVLRDSVLHVSQTSYSLEKLDRALSASGNRLMRETGLNVETFTATFTAGERSLDLADVRSDFLSGNATEAPFITANDKFHRLKVVAWATLREQIEMSAAASRPELIAFITQTEAYIYPTPAEDTTLTFVYRRPLVSWTMGVADGDSVTLNVPDQYVHDWIWWGARSYLLHGLPNHKPEASTAQAEFAALIQRAKGASLMGGVYYGDSDSGEQYDNYL